MAGRNGIGVAPGAQWIACRACLGINCPSEYIIGCGQWMTCPTLPNGTNPDCTKAPHVINNSYGGAPRGDKTFLNMIKSWRAAGMKS